MLNNTVKWGKELTEAELDIINTWRKKEFNSDHPWNRQYKDYFYDHVIFLLKENDTLLAFGRLRPVSLYQETKVYEIWGISTIIAIIRHKGYGKQIMNQISKYIATHKKTAIGFCKKHNTPFYEKCGFRTIAGAKRNFIHADESDTETPGKNDDFFYIKGDDELIEVLLKNPQTTFKHYIPHW